ncbi:hypothetical protein C2G38_2227761 [Gigaspora rosea]|uniref:Uncharacterized protein n=1 Tax=Gigaspora rosea TaxID=44941 RepID=A0A397U0A5_9GLOM|nr:hypothetical protein C2G38_2227761 [Gigaspora rosea]
MKRAPTNDNTNGKKKYQQRKQPLVVYAIICHIAKKAPTNNDETALTKKLMKLTKHTPKTMTKSQYHLRFQRQNKPKIIQTPNIAPNTTPTTTLTTNPTTKKKYKAAKKQICKRQESKITIAQNTKKVKEARTQKQRKIQKGSNTKSKNIKK